MVHSVLFSCVCKTSGLKVYTSKVEYIIYAEVFPLLILHHVNEMLSWLLELKSDFNDDVINILNKLTVYCDIKR